MQRYMGAEQGRSVLDRQLEEARQQIADLQGQREQDAATHARLLGNHQELIAHCEQVEKTLDHVKASLQLDPDYQGMLPAPGKQAPESKGADPRKAVAGASSGSQSAPTGHVATAPAASQALHPAIASSSTPLIEGSEAYIAAFSNVPANLQALFEGVYMRTQALRKEAGVDKQVCSKTQNDYARLLEESNAAKASAAMATLKANQLEMQLSTALFDAKTANETASEMTDQHANIATRLQLAETQAAVNKAKADVYIARSEGLEKDVAGLQEDVARLEQANEQQADRLQALEREGTERSKSLGHVSSAFVLAAQSALAMQTALGMHRQKDKGRPVRKAATWAAK